MHVDLIKLYGSMELAPLVGLADAIVDLVSSGGTLRANNLVEVEEIMQISSRLVVNQAALKLKREALQPILDAFERASVPKATERARPAARDTETETSMSIKIRKLDSSANGFQRALRAVLAFEASEDEAIERSVAQILADVKARGDAAVLEYTNRFDRLKASSVAALELPHDGNAKPRSKALEPKRRAALRSGRRRACAAITRGRRSNAAAIAGTTPKPTAPCSARRSRRSIAPASTCRAARRRIRRRC